MTSLILVLTACAPSTADGLYEGPPPRAPLAETIAEAPRTLPTPLSGTFDPRTPHASSTLVQSADGAFVYTVDTENGTVVRVDLDEGTTDRAVVGLQPSRLTRIDDRILVSLRGGRAIVELSADLQVLRTLTVGAEPLGIVARPDGERFYVAVSEEDVILEIDAASFAVTARIAVEGGPRTLAIHPDGQRLFVGTGRGISKLLVVDLVSLASRSLPLPAPRAPFSLPTVPRITGDLALQGGAEVSVWVPVLFADTQRRTGESPGPYYAPPPGFGGTGEEVGFVTPTVVEVVVDSGGEGVHLVRTPLLLEAEAPPEEGLSSRVRSYPTAIDVASDGTVRIALEASDAVLELGPDEGSWETLSGSGLVIAPLDVVPTGSTPRGVLSVGERWVALEGFDHQLRVTDSETTESIPIGPPDADPVAEQGRRLFYSARDLRMTSGGISCSTCHFEGRSDGLTWRLVEGLRQTPTLAGGLSATQPFTWSGEVGTVAEEIRRTSRRRMGGQRLGTEDQQAIVTWLDQQRPADAPSTLDAAAVARGANVFSQAGCGACHPGGLGTDNEMHTFDVEASNTPKLVGLASSAPYLQDGSAATLRDVLERAREPEQMGDTADLTAGELDDLEAYLRAL